jgi:hypothetical protein
MEFKIGGAVGWYLKLKFRENRIHLMTEEIEMFRQQNSSHDSIFNENAFQYSNFSVCKLWKASGRSSDSLSAIKNTARTIGLLKG